MLKIEATYIQQFNAKRGLMFIPHLIIDGIKTSIQDAQPCNSKEAALSEAEAVIKNYPTKITSSVDEKTVKDKINYAEPNEDAAARLKEKMEVIRNTIDTMSKDEYGDWVDKLEFDEFIELIKLTDK